MDNASMRRKADALEKAGGDPAKVAELRALAPAERRTAPKQTTAKPDVEKAEEKTESKRPVGRPRLSATRGDNK